MTALVTYFFAVFGAFRQGIIIRCRINRAFHDKPGIGVVPVLMLIKRERRRAGRQSDDINVRFAERRNRIQDNQAQKVGFQITDKG